MKSTARVTVGLPVHNGERHIEETLDSLLSQTFTDFELIISDNASTDRTRDISTRYAARDTRVRYVRCEENIGGAKNFARVFELARSPYFKWAAHDDLCEPTFLERCVAILDADPSVVLCYPKTAFIDEQSTLFALHDSGPNLQSDSASERAFQYLASDDTRCFPIFGVIRRAALANTCLLPTYVSGDQVLLLQLALQGKFHELPERLFLFREHPDRPFWEFRTFAEYLRWHDPKSRSRIVLPRWRLAFEFIRSITRADIDWRDALHCYIATAKWCRWHYRPLCRDLTLAAHQLTRIACRRPLLSDKDGAPPKYDLSTVGANRR
jgi:glycosyltransferase involved in cell wall biosynthesis